MVSKNTISPSEETGSDLPENGIPGNLRTQFLEVDSDQRLCIPFGICSTRLHSKQRLSSKLLHHIQAKCASPPNTDVTVTYYDYLKKTNTWPVRRVPPIISYSESFRHFNPKRYYFPRSHPADWFRKQNGNASSRTDNYRNSGSGNRKSNFANESMF